MKNEKATATPAVNVNANSPFNRIKKQFSGIRIIQDTDDRIGFYNKYGMLKQFKSEYTAVKRFNKELIEKENCSLAYQVLSAVYHFTVEKQLSNDELTERPVKIDISRVWKMTGESGAIDPVAGIISKRDAELINLEKFLKMVNTFLQIELRGDIVEFTGYKLGVNVENLGNYLEFLKKRTDYKDNATQKRLAKLVISNKK